ETPEQAADRELKEEAGYGARRLDVLRQLTLVPTYMGHVSWLVLARDLNPERLPGDEPAELAVIPWKMQELDRLMLREDFSEGRSLAALFVAREWLARQDRKSTRLNSSHVKNSYAVFCLKKKKQRRSGAVR